MVVFQLHLKLPPNDLLNKRVVSSANKGVFYRQETSQILLIWSIFMFLKRKSAVQTFSIAQRKILINKIFIDLFTNLLSFLFFKEKSQMLCWPALIYGWTSHNPVSLTIIRPDQLLQTVFITSHFAKTLCFKRTF